MFGAAIEESGGVVSKVYDEPQYNVAFERFVDVLARLMQKYGTQLLEQTPEMTKDDYTLTMTPSKMSASVYQERSKAS